jgi:Oxidoreductase family, NAD-binding Rossmann fold/WD domain, G-beta repeat
MPTTQPIGYMLFRIFFSLLAQGMVAGGLLAAEPMLQPHFTIRKLPDAATSVAFSPKGDLLAVGSYETVELWNVTEKSRVGSIPVKSGFARSLAFSPDGTHLAIGGYQRIHLHSVEARALVRDIKGHRGYVTAVVWSAAGDRLYSASEDQTVCIWVAADGTGQSQFKDFSAPVMGLSLSPDGTLLAIAGGDETQLTKPGFAQLRKVTGEVVHELATPKRPATDIAFTPDGKQVVLTGFDEQAHLFQVDTGVLVGDYTGHARPTNSVAFTAQGRLALTASGGRFQGKNELHAWSLADRKLVTMLEPAEGRLTRIAVSPSGQWLAVAAANKNATVWDLSGLTVPATAPIAPVEEKQPMTRLAPTGPLQFISAEGTPMKRIGIIGLDTSHAIAFTKTFNADPPNPALAGMRVMVAYPHGSQDIEGSVSRIPGYTEEIKTLGVTVVDSLPALLEQVDYVLLETNDGRPHLEQALAVFKAGKPVFIDKPVAGSLEDAVAIYEAARHYKVPLFSSSSLRFMEDAQAARNGACGKVLGCDTFSPCSLEKTHPDLFWYGIHGVEILYTVMGPGCQTVNRSSTPDADVVLGTWKEGRIGTFRGMRGGKSGYGGNVFGADKYQPLGNFKGYDPLVLAIGKFFATGQAPVTEEETLEIYAFMEAADESKRQGGATVSVPATLEKARAVARARFTP